MNRLGLILIVLCLLAGAAGAGWWFFLRAPDDAQAAAAAASRGAGQAENDGDLLMKGAVELHPITLPILRNGRVRAHVTLVLTIELAEQRHLDELQSLRPRLRHAVLSELYGMYALRHVQEHGHELPVVRLRIRQASEAVLGEGGVKAVYFKSMTRRNLETS